MSENLTKDREIGIIKQKMPEIYPPKEIWIKTKKNTHNLKPNRQWQSVPIGSYQVKYIRADFIELTWEDIWQIVNIYSTLDSSPERPVGGNAICEETLKRFKEYKSHDKEQNTR
jgi:hypothetical protein